MRKSILLITAACLLGVGCPPSSTTRPGGQADATSPFSVAGMTKAVLEIEAALGTGQIQGLQQKYNAEAKADSKNPFKLFLWAYSLTDRNQAWGELTKITKLNDKFYWAYLGMAVILDGWKVDDQAENNFKKALQIGPGIAIGHGRLGRMYLRKKDSAKALPALETAVAHDPRQVDYLLDLARALDLAGKGKQAQEKYRAALQLEPSLFVAAAELADLLKRSGDKEAAIVAYAQAAALDASAYDVRFSRAVLMAELGPQSEGLAAMQKACELKPETLACWQALAKLSAKMKKQDVQVTAFENVVRLDKNDIAAFKFLGQVYLAAGEIEKALPAYQRVLKKEKDNLEVLVGLATIYEKGGEYSKAIEFNERVLSASPGNGSALEARKRLFERFRILETPISGKNPDRVFAGNRRQIAKVYKELLEKKPGLKGDILLKVTVTNGGTVEDVVMAKNTVGEQVIDLCAYWNLRRSKFPQGFGATYDFELTLTPPKK